MASDTARINKAVKALSGLGDHDLEIALRAMTMNYALEFAWPDSYTKASLNKLHTYIVSLNDRDGSNKY